MTSAERMRTIARQARENVNAEKARDYDDYVKQLILGKITKSARKGRNVCLIKIKKSIPSWAVIDRLQNSPRCFKVESKYANGRNYLRVYW